MITIQLGDKTAEKLFKKLQYKTNPLYVNLWKKLFKALIIKEENETNQN